ncbi:uncharacterized protein LOC9654847 [Selaginella moellendorffii]|uniref:uncharacterized protein LOC9654847 n=1 Tax=Selaginella moellendorffii TaxID=88036 RepID=UPI000D1CFAD4|nr:uncharacterized protein LOC9654847 [Selaginella moellendorffii]|eukprot:XP_024524944.1 uncharacterized protein LOC9654847 [Selaginella moellendorffii]
MDHHPHYYRGRDGLPHFAAMDSLDLNLHLAPPPAAVHPAATPPYPLWQPSRSELMGHGMFNFQPLPTPQPIWTRFFLEYPPSPSPPSPGEIDFSNPYHYHDYHHEHHSPFWGMDFSDVDSGQELDLDLSPLLHDHFLREEDDELEAALLEGEEQHPQEDGDRDHEHDWWGARSSSAATTTRLNSSGRATPAAAVAAVAATEAPQSSSSKSQYLPRKKNSASASSLDLNPQQHQQQQQDEDQSQAKLLCDDQEQQQQRSGSGKEFFFDCNVCFDVASEPVVTSCGHLFCWPCLYQWLHVHSHNDECPVCKGAVSDADVIPIYGRGGDGGASVERSCPSANIFAQHIPARPRARRADSVRLRQPGTDVALAEMLRWRRFMRMWHQHTSRLMLERRGAIDGGGRPAMAPASMIDQLHHQWPYNVASTELERRM